VDGGENTRLAFFTAEPHVERMCIDRYGNVGVGTTTPGEKLQIVGDSIAMTSDPSNDDYGQLSLTSASNYTNGSKPTQLKIGIDHTVGSFGTGFIQGIVDFTHSGINLALCPKLGNVGIATQSPDKTLDVNGITRSRKTAGWKSGTFNSTGVNMGPMADGTTDGPQIGWEYHITFSAASAGSRVVVYGAYKHSGALYAASETWTWRFREGYSSLDYSNYAELVNNSETAHASYYAVIRVVNSLYTNADVGNARHHFMSHSVGTYAGVGASIWQAQGYIDMGGESSDDRFNYLRITSSNGNIKGQWTAFPITT